MYYIWIKRYPQCRATADLFHILSKLTIGVQTRILQQLTKYADNPFYPSQFASLVDLTIKEKFVTLEHMRIIFFYILLKPSILLNSELDQK